MRTVVFIGQKSRVQGGAEKYFYTLFCDLTNHINNCAGFNDVIIEYNGAPTLRQILQYTFSQKNLLFLVNISVLFQFSPVYLLLSLVKKNVLILPHIVTSPTLMRPRFLLVRYFLYYLNFLLASRILCISDGNKQQLSTLPLANQKKIVPVYNYVDFSSPTLSKIEHPRFPLNIAVIGRLQNKHKGQYDLIKNIACYIKTSDINILLFGDGPDHNLLKSAISYYSIENNVQILGHVRTESIYKKHLFSVVLSYSYWEGLPLNLLEAYSFGKIVVGRNIPGVREIVFPQFCFSSDADLCDILTNLHLHFLDKDFFADYSRFVLDVLSKYNKLSSISSLANELI